jgi:DNA polymerase III epsilon subunit-like protein
MSRYVSIDIETTGLNEEHCQIIEIGAVVDDFLNPLAVRPTFHCYVKHNIFKGEPYALAMHAEIFRRIATMEAGYDYYWPGEVATQLGQFLKENGVYLEDPENPRRERRGVVAGKNYANFDDKFLRKLPKYDEWVKLHHRVLDPAMLYWNPLLDIKPPGMKTCMERAGIRGEVAHTAVDDAIVVCELVNRAAWVLKTS